MRIQHYHRKTSSYSEGSPSYRKPYISRSHYGIPSRKPKEVKTSQVPTQNYKKCKSRIVTVIYQEGKKNMGKENLKERLGNNLVRERYSKKPHSTCFDFPPKRPNYSLTCCPNAPHNTTSFLMNFHRDEILNNKLELDRSWTSDDDYDDLPEFPCHSYGSFFGSLGDSYEVASQISAPQ